MFFFFFTDTRGSRSRDGGNKGQPDGGRIAAAVRVMQMAGAYLEEGMLEVLVSAILKKKLAWIEKAQTKEELRLIVKPSVPHYNGGTFEGGKYHVEEEELILWSKASLQAPLNQVGYKRYMELFRKIFPEEAGKLFRE